MEDNNQGLINGILSISCGVSLAVVIGLFVLVAVIVMSVIIIAVNSSAMAPESITQANQFISTTLTLLTV